MTKRELYNIELPNVVLGLSRWAEIPPRGQTYSDSPEGAFRSYIGEHAGNQTGLILYKLGKDSTFRCENHAELAKEDSLVRCLFFNRIKNI